MSNLKLIIEASEPQSNGITRAYSKAPAVLTENFFQDSLSDLRFLQSREGKDALTILHCEGVIEYLNRSSVEL